MRTQITRGVFTPLRSIKPRAAVAALGISMLVGTPLSADDLEVFTAGISSDTKPNILFVLDFSGSMNSDINGEDPADTGLPSRISILREAVAAVLADSVDSANIGLGPMFSLKSGGVQWPIGPLDEDAHNIDPNIPPGTQTSADVINSLLEFREVRRSTATVPAMAETGMYFRGGNVSVDGSDPNHSLRFTPSVWDPAAQAYSGGFYLAPNPATYSPRDAYRYNANAAGTFSYCSDFSISGGNNDCAGLATYDCEFVAARGETPAFDSATSSKARNVCKVPHPDQWLGANYNSPIVDECQQNFMVLISDGEPRRSGNLEAIEEITGLEPSACEDLSTSIFGLGAGEQPSGNCGFEVAEALATNDQNPNVRGSTVQTYTVGFAVEEGDPGRIFLEELAKRGKGEFFDASRPEDLSAALQSIIDSILGDSESFAEVSVDINKATFSSDDRLYFPLFKPSLSPSWQGNVKGYFLAADGIKDVRGNPATIATDSGTVFDETSMSFWSSANDGNRALEGGVSENLAAGNRNLYTFTDNNIPAGGVSLNSVAGNYDLSVANADVDYKLLNIPNNAANRSDLLNWIQEQPIGAPLHSKLQTINYAGGKRVLYTITNQGFLHAFDVSRPGKGGTNDTAGGEEIYAFMPKELLQNLEPQRTGITTKNHIYGLDGNITRWHDDLNNDGVVNNGEEALLIFGMRRGGNNYYAMDVTNPENPVLKWQIEGGKGQFQKLAQSWSRASLIRVQRNSGEERVLVFGGGYDGALDDLNKREQSSGNSVFMVDRDGKKIWSANHPQMNYAVPSDIAVIDSDSDALADRMYFGDLGGQVWRVDMDNVDKPADFEINRIADTSDGGYQPFFYAPSVAFQDLLSNSYMSVSIGSGNRDNPLDDGSRNAFYVFKDEDFRKGKPPTTPNVVSHNALFDATLNEVASSNNTIAQTARNLLLASPGWRIDLQPGEKALSQTVTFAGRLLATTFQPTNPNANADMCGAPPNTGRFYMLDVVTGEPVEHLGDADEDLPLNRNNRSTVISTTGIPTTPVILFPEDQLSAKVLVGKEVVGEVDNRVRRVYWFAEQ